MQKSIWLLKCRNIWLLKCQNLSSFWNDEVCLIFKMLKFIWFSQFWNLWGFWNVEICSAFKWSKFIWILKYWNMYDFWNDKIYLNFKMMKFVWILKRRNLIGYGAFYEDWIVFLMQCLYRVLPKWRSLQVHSVSPSNNHVWTVYKRLRPNKIWAHTKRFNLLFELALGCI